MRISLPTTGYIVLHTIHRDGDTPNLVTNIECKPKTDADAIAKFTADVDQLRRNAPADVLHTLRLGDRTGAGDRVLVSDVTVRGAGPSLASQGF